MDYAKFYSGAYKSDIVEAMLNIAKYNLYVHGNDIHNSFEMIPERMAELPEFMQEEIEEYRYSAVEPEPEIQAAEISRDQRAEYVSKPEKQEPAPQVLINTNEVKISSLQDPTKPKDDLTELERKLLTALNSNGGLFESANKWYVSAGERSGEVTKNAKESLEKRGYIEVISDAKTQRQAIRITEKGMDIIL